MTSTSAVGGLRGSVTGQVLAPGDGGFDEACRIWNGTVDRRPALIVRCETAQDVAEALGHAQDQGLPVAVRSGGHSVAGLSICEGGVLVDLGPLRHVEVDAGARIARVGPGARWGDVDPVTQAHGLATTGGVDSRTGVGGLTLGGGVGWLAREHGLTIDNLRAAEVVTASGDVLRASADEHADLFWALRGGGGNFGVVTELELALHEVGPEVMVAQVFFPHAQAAAALRGYRDLMATAPDELACYAFVMKAPPGDPFPTEHQGRPALALVACHTGSAEQAAEDLAAFTSLGEPLVELVAPMPYVALQTSFDDGTPDGGRYHWKSEYLAGLSDGLIDVVVEATEELPGEYTMLGIESLGGAVSRVEPASTAFANRAAAYSLGIWPGWTDPADDEARIAWARQVHAAAAPHGMGTTYVNYLDRDEMDRVPEVYGANLARLRDVKAQYDPGNVFHANANITPAT